MFRNKTLIAALSLATILSSGAVWAETQPANNPKQAMSPQETAAAKDFGTLSADGSRAFQDLTLTRLAIFNGNTNEAKTLINEAKTDFEKAKSDKSVFTKAEADLKGNDAPMTAAANDGATKAQDNAQADAMKKPISWLPVDGEISITEDYSANPAKTAAVADANKKMAAGDRKGAMDSLKLADVDVDVAIAVVPLKQTLSDVDQAADLINSGKYYEASQMLRQVQGNVHVDLAQLSEKPKSGAATSSSPAAPAKTMPEPHKS